MKKYSKYRDSGVEWLGEIPEKWGIKKVKHLTTKIGSGITPKGGAEVYQASGIPLLRSQNVHFTGLKLDDVAYISEQIHSSMSNSEVFENDVLLNITGASIGRCYYVNPSILPANVNQHVCILRPNDEVEKEYLYFLLSSAWGQFLIDYCQNGANREGLNFEQIKNFNMPMPSRDERRAIANFLAQKTSQIDSLIEKKRKMIELLKEERAAIINQAVTKGINPDAEMKDSGIEWLGEVPKHWEVTKLKYITELISKGTTPSTIGADTIENGDVRFIKAENIVNNELQEIPDFWITRETDELIKRSKLKNGDVLIVIAGATIGKVAIINNKFLPANTNQAVCFIRPKVEKISRLIWYWLQTNFVRQIILLDAVQAAQPNLSMERIGNFQFLLPKAAEILEILGYIDKKTHSIDSSIDEIEKEISLLEEYRTALINEAVTGKIDIMNREAGAYV